ncbi:MAG TPA: hypothetical protein VH142_00215 [Polyangiaceae bacterium]|jgi:hypothetical protein|nr:hypothetical protein [Polyangiaceae bacterium]
MKPFGRVAALTALIVTTACVTYREGLNRGQRLYDTNEYDKALAIWRDLEPDMDSLSVNDQSRYAYLRGMTDYRLGYRPDARHWLAIAKAIDDKNPGGLNDDWKARTNDALNDLNREVYGGPEAADGGAPHNGPDPGSVAAGGMAGTYNPDTDMH